ncbi:hypothetical protein BKA62DRAFT_720065 [Auriculariales sp. MPI-PUGE-AT-0066]|nr:hypothetical protein BKA62DRAFT_720065 [Auriculariales sp. MPI-PUGE-AT-0066]
MSGDTLSSIPYELRCQIVAHVPVGCLFRAVGRLSREWREIAIQDPRYILQCSVQTGGNDGLQKMEQQLRDLRVMLRHGLAHGVRLSITHTTSLTDPAIREDHIIRPITALCVCIGLALPILAELRVEIPYDLFNQLMAALQREAPVLRLLFIDASVSPCAQPDAGANLVPVLSSTIFDGSAPVLRCLLMRNVSVGTHPIPGLITAQELQTAKLLSYDYPLLWGTERLALVLPNLSSASLTINPGSSLRAVDACLDLPEVDLSGLILQTLYIRHLRFRPDALKVNFSPVRRPSLRVLYKEQSGIPNAEVLDTLRDISGSLTALRILRPPSSNLFMCLDDLNSGKRRTVVTDPGVTRVALLADIYLTQASHLVSLSLGDSDAGLLAGKVTLPMLENIDILLFDAWHYWPERSSTQLSSVGSPKESRFPRLKRVSIRGVDSRLWVELAVLIHLGDVLCQTQCSDDSSGHQVTLEYRSVDLHPGFRAIAWCKIVARGYRHVSFIDLIQDYSF